MLLVYDSMYISSYEEMHKVNLPSSTAQKVQWDREDKCLSVCFLARKRHNDQGNQTIKHLNRGLLAISENQHIIIMVERVAAGRQKVLEKYLSAHI